MKNKFLQFRGEYFRFVGAGKNNDDPGINIGSNEGAFLADLVSGFLFERCDFSRLGGLHYRGIFRDDGMILCDANLRDEEILKWVEQDFQIQVNNLAGYSDPGISFTCEIWTPDVENFNFLDLNFSWSESGNLLIRNFTKPNARLKYLNAESLHRTSVLE